MSGISAVKKYFKQVCDAYNLGNVETSYNNPIITLIEEFGAQARDLSGSRSKAAGENIDILLWHEGENTNETEPFAGIEVKKVGGIDPRANEQVIAAVENYGNAILTDNMVWWFWEIKEGKPKKYSGVQLIEIVNGALKLKKDSVELFISLIQDFLLSSPATIKSSSKLSEYMAIHAKTIRSVVVGLLKADANGQPLVDERQLQLPLFKEFYSLYSKIKSELRPYLDTQSFADMYAQTIVYGLFIARYNSDTLETFNRFEAIGNLRQESSLLRLFFSHIATSNIEHPTLEAAIDKLCDLYRIADVRALLDKDEEKDTIIHFYEDFLNSYDPVLKKSLGVYYTPYQVVRYMVRMVDKVLIEEFGIEGGLSDNSTIDIELPTAPYTEGKKEKTTVTRTVPRVSILDPAVGTGTFHAEIIRYVHDTYFSGGKEAFWKDYILDKNGLMGRLIGFEIMMTSYVVAHLKVRRTIDETLSADDVPNSSIPASNIFLTNTLAPPQTKLEDANQLSIFGINDFSGAITEEAKRADEWKSRRPIKVIIGNPPYSSESVNQYDLKAYKTETNGTSKLLERNIKPLNDDYVKFIRFAEERILECGTGILSFITPHGYFENPTFRGMRASLLRTFDLIYILDLHGNSTKNEVAPDGSADVNVFDIRQGVGIILAFKLTGNLEWARVYHVDAFGTRSGKFDLLGNEDFSISQYRKIESIDTTTACFSQSTSSLIEPYKCGVRLDKLMPINAIGLITGRVNMAIQNSRNGIAQVVKNAINMDSETFRSFYNLGKDARDWKAEWVKQDIVSSSGATVRINLFPFDSRWTYYTGNLKGFHTYPRGQIMKHLINDDFILNRYKNFGLVFAKQTTLQGCWDGIFVSDQITERHFIDYPARGSGFIAPLYLIPEGAETEWRPNYSKSELTRLIENAEKKPNPFQVFDYIYGILHDPIYRNKYQELLKRDFPRVPIIANLGDKDNPDAFYVSEERFWQYVEAGSRLRQLHLLEVKEPVDLQIEPNTADDLEIGAVKFVDGVLCLNKNKRILGIPKNVWNYYIGGYQVLPKWFKSHKGEQFDYEKMKHIENVVGALVETVKIQKELELISSHRLFDIQFNGASND